MQKIVAVRTILFLLVLIFGLSLFWAKPARAEEPCECTVTAEAPNLALNCGPRNPNYPFTVTTTLRTGDFPISSFDIFRAYENTSYPAACPGTNAMRNVLRTEALARLSDPQCSARDETQCYVWSFPISGDANQYFITELVTTPEGAGHPDRECLSDLGGGILRPCLGARTGTLGYFDPDRSALYIREDTCSNFAVREETLHDSVELSCGLYVPPPPPPEPPAGPTYEYKEVEFSLPYAEAARLNQFPNATIQILGGRMVRWFLSIMGTAALGMFIYAGLLWMFSGGNAERQKKALLTMLWTSVGLVVMLSSYAIVTFILSAFG
jgi:cbb3-type cytochrome oxidase subunit 3